MSTWQTCATRCEVPLLLNPAPARKISQKSSIVPAYLTPNEHEADVLFNGMKPSEALKQYPDKVFITEGAAGVRYHDGTKEILVPSFKVEVDRYDRSR